MKSRLKEFWQILRNAISEFRWHNAIKLSASLSFFTILTLGPMMIVILFISNLFLSSQAMEGKIYDQISEAIGHAASIKIKDIIKDSSISNNFIPIFGIVTLVFAATTVFSEMQDSMNTIWNIKVKSGKAWKQILKNRLISFFIVAGIGFILLISLIINGLLENFMGSLKQMFPQIGFVVVYIVNLILTLLVVTFFFTFIFKVLPDIHLRWKDVVAGAIFTTVLFMAGKYAITFFLHVSKMSGTYGSAGSLLILLLWIFYSSIVLYFGAEFTKSYILKNGIEVKPKDYALSINIVIEENK